VEELAMVEKLATAEELAKTMIIKGKGRRAMQRWISSVTVEERWRSTVEEQRKNTLLYYEKWFL